MMVGLSDVRVAPHNDNISVITGSDAVHAFLCDTSIIVKIAYTGSFDDKHCDCAPLFISYIFYYDMI